MLIIYIPVQQFSGFPDATFNINITVHLPAHPHSFPSKPTSHWHEPLVQ